MKISFCDFWEIGGKPSHSFHYDNNMFLDMFIDNFDTVKPVPPSEDPDFLFFSVFGGTHCKADRNKTKKIFFTGENIRPNSLSQHYDLSLSFDYDQGSNIRFPLWYYHIDWYKKGGYNNPQYIIPKNCLYKNKYIDRPKNKFCSTVYSNPHPLRNEVFEKLNFYKKVDRYGQPFSHCDYGEDVKYDIISQYKFNMCLESSSHPGYHTEKLLQAKIAGCIPIYWGAKTVSQDFNHKCFINLEDFDNTDSFIDYIKLIDNDDSLYLKMLSEPLFNKTPDIKGIANKIKIFFNL
jgi:hypothetical protein